MPEGDCEEPNQTKPKGQLVGWLVSGHKPAYKSHKHLRAQTGQEGPRPRVDSPVSEPTHHRLVISLR